MIHIRRCALLILTILLASCGENITYQLHRAAEKGDTAKVKELIAKGTNVDVQENCMTPLMKAVLNVHLDTVKALLIAGANPATSDCSGANAFSYAQKINSGEIMRLLTRADSLRRAGYKPTEADLEMITDAEKDRRTYGPTDVKLHSACLEGDVKTVVSLLNSGSDIESKNTDGETPLKTASIAGRKNVVKVLLERGANADAKDKYGNTPLIEAARFGHIEIARMLIAKGADINAKSEMGYTALGEADGNGHTAMVRFLKKAGAKE